MDQETNLLRPVPREQQHFGRYTLLYRIASGGMANVYLAFYAGPDRFEKIVAIKRIHEHLAENPEFGKMFVDEARLAARISHPNVVQVLELGSVQGSYFIAMEYVEGESLNALLRRTDVPLDIAASIISQAAQGLHAAHELRNLEGQVLSVVHRDVSPSNILVGYGGAVKVVDFGVAKAKGNTATTDIGVVKGKFSYIAPEQLLPDMADRVDRRADIFSLGIVLYELTTRQRLFKANTEAAVSELVLHRPIVPPSQIMDHYPPQLETIVLRALQRPQEERFQTAHEMHLALESFLASQSSPILHSTIGEMMEKVFGDRIEEKAGMMRNCRKMIDEAPSVKDLTFVTSATLRAAAGELTPAPGKHRRIFLVGIGPLLAVVFVAALLVYGLARSPKPEMRQAVSSQLQAPHPIRISIRASPEDAVISFDGKRVPNPFEIKREAGEGTTKITVSASGYKSRSFDLSLSEGGKMIVALERLFPSTQAAGGGDKGTNGTEKNAKHLNASEGKLKQKKSSSKKRVRDLFKNPYED